jgi:allantoicase
MTDSFEEMVDLASERLGGVVLLANDEFFAPKEALLKPTPAEWRADAYTERGKWMDGWESRRRRTPGYDWAVVRLGVAGIIHGVVVDTASAATIQSTHPSRPAPSRARPRRRSWRRRRGRRSSPAAPCRATRATPSPSIIRTA